VNAPLDPLAAAPGPILASGAVRSARARGALERRPVLEILGEDLGLSPEELLAAVGATFGFETLSMAELDHLEAAFDALPFALASSHECLALRRAEQLVLVIWDPFNERVREWGREQIRQPLEWAIAQRADIAAYLSRHEQSLRAIDSLAPESSSENADGPAQEELSIRSISEDRSPIVRLVHSTLYDALKSGASDIHLESLPTGLSIKYRIDGTLLHVNSAEGIQTAEQVLSRLKVMSELDISERRIPQDGRFRVRSFGRDIDFRVSIMPCIHGEDAVLRILDKRGLADELTGLRLDVLGFEDDILAIFRRLSREPYGLLLVTGPTGSGKTTSLYAAITEINNGHDKIITIEDPVEYQLQGVLQIPVNEKKGLTFARGLRSVLRHDPDRIMVGEIRDPETAQIAVQAALTGHLVFSTVHANNVFDVIGRFTHMNVDPYAFVSALNGVLAQRLVRVNCPSCSEPSEVAHDVLAESGIDPARVVGATLRAGRGCGKCRGTGFKGRRAVGELLVLTDELRELIVAKEPIRKIKDAARRGGTRLLRDGAIELFLRGQTTLAEVNRVTLVS
jgi:general secretion pathway protein E